MRRIEMMTAGGVTLSALGALAALAISSSDGAGKLAVQRTPPFEVRTEVIRKTVNLYRRERPHHAGASGASPTGSTAGSGAPASSLTRTRSSGTRSVAPAAPVLTTRSSGSRSSSASPAGPSPSQPVTTRTSGGGRSGSSRPVTTRSSGGGGEHDGGQGD